MKILDFGFWIFDLAAIRRGVKGVERVVNRTRNPVHRNLLTAAPKINTAPASAKSEYTRKNPNTNTHDLGWSRRSFMKLRKPFSFSLATKLEPTGTAFPMPQSTRPERKAIRPVLMTKFDFIAKPYVNTISPTNMTGATQRMSQMNVSDRRLFMPYCGLTEENIQGSPGVGERTTQDAPHPCPSPRPSWSCQNGEREKFRGDVLPRVALVPHLPWATIRSPLRGFSLVRLRRERWQRKLRGL